LTPATLVATYELRNYDGEWLPSKTYGVAFGTLTLRAASIYGITLAATPLGTTTAGWEGSNGAIRNGGLSFVGNGYPDVFFAPSLPAPSDILRLSTGSGRR
jgi:hypothetical protein